MLWFDLPPSDPLRSVPAMEPPLRTLEMEDTLGALVLSQTPSCSRCKILSHFKSGRLDEGTLSYGLTCSSEKTMGWRFSHDISEMTIRPRHLGVNFSCDDFSLQSLRFPRMGIYHWPKCLLLKRHPIENDVINLPKWSLMVVCKSHLVKEAYQFPSRNETMSIRPNI